jgi:hypothetical protein
MEASTTSPTVNYTIGVVEVVWVVRVGGSSSAGRAGATTSARESAAARPARTPCSARGPQASSWYQFTAFDLGMQKKQQRAVAGPEHTFLTAPTECRPRRGFVLLALLADELLGPDLRADVCDVVEVAHPRWSGVSAF